VEDPDGPCRMVLARCSGTSYPGSTRGLFDRNPATFADNIDRFIQHGSIPDGPSPAFSMPAFGDSHALTQPQVANIEAYLLRLNGVDRAAIVAPGIRPRPFFWGALATFGGICGVLALLWRRRGSSGSTASR
jgi:hypothetical protein